MERTLATAWLSGAALLLAALALGSACTLTDLDKLKGGVGGGGEGGGDVVTGCVSVTDCSASENPCEAPTCVDGNCGFVAAASGTKLLDAEQMPGDCLSLVCDGAGNSLPQNDDSDVPPMEDCVTKTCLSGTVQPTDHDLGTACGDPTDNKICDGVGHCVECVVASDCVGLPADGECGKRECNGGMCNYAAVQAGTVVASFQNPGDCKVNVCDGAGGITSQADPADVQDDGNDCTTDSCNGMMPVHTNVTNGDSCGTQGVCNAGVCVGCNTAADCSGSNDDCKTRTCVNNACGWNFAPAGPTSTQILGDCKQRECDGNGVLSIVSHPSDVPLDDGNQCTAESCNGGSPQHPPKVVDSACSQNGGKVCDGAGTCVQCNSPSQCPIAPVCQFATCINKSCGVDNTAQGTPTQAQVPGDCKLQICTGSGSTTTQNQDTDLPNDGNQCTADVCSMGVPSNPAVPAGAACSQMNGSYCNGSGSCVQCTNNNHCAAAEYCSSNSCVPDKPNGQSCTAAAQCTSGFCADGFCCNVACSGNCQACAAAIGNGPNGTCSTVDNNTDPHGGCSGLNTCFNGVCCNPNPVSASPQSAGDPVESLPCPMSAD